MSTLAALCDFRGVGFAWRWRGVEVTDGATSAAVL